MLGLKDKTAIVTGASRGIGQAIAVCLTRYGVHVALCARSEAGLHETAALCEQHPGKATCFPLDMGKAEAIKDTVAAIHKDLGRIDILVNNAGITKDGLLARMSEEDWDAVMNINLKGPFLMSKAVARIMMKQRSGSMVNVSSIIGVIGNPGQANYAASKGGVNALTKSLAKELAVRGIRVNAVAPGFIQTSMTEELGEDGKQRMLDLIPLRRLGEPEQVAETVAFLASDSSSYITGQVVSVCGGMVTS